jgi:hypothetical protein
MESLIAVAKRHEISTLRGTRYIVVASKGAEQILVGMTPRISRAGLLAVLRNRGQALIDRLAIGETDQITFGTKPRPFATVAGWMIAFTGQTERDYASFSPATAQETTKC